MSAKKKVVILTYWFPPCNLTASQRALGFAKYLHGCGWDPVVITRNWEQPIASAKDLSLASGTSIKTSQHKEYTLIELPYLPDFRDKLITSEKQSRLRLVLQKFLSLVEIIAGNFSMKAVPFANIYHFADEYIRNNKNSIHSIVVSANPWIFFRFGYLLNAKHHLPWVADYRDDWTTRTFGHWYQKIKFLEKPGRAFEGHFEKKWLSTASSFISVSPDWVKKIGKFINKKGEVVMNGFIPEDFILNDVKAFDAFTFCYCGSIFEMHRIEIFCEGLLQLEKHFRGRIKVRAYFAGAAFEKSSEERIRNLFDAHPDALHICGRISRQKAIRIQLQSQVLVMVPYGDIKGAPSSKIFDYIATTKPVLICPGDNDIIEEMLQTTGQGIVCNTSAEMFQKMSVLIERYLSSNNTGIQVNEQAINSFTRAKQTQKLSAVLSSLSA